jgi:uncharacterized protein (DUF58 family)
LIAILLLALGFFKTINPLLLLGYLLLATVAFNAVFAGWPLRRVRVRRLVEGPVFAGSPCIVEIVLDNRGRRTVRGVGVEDVGPDHSLKWFATGLAGGESRSLRQQLVLPRRGLYSGTSLALVSGYPFGLVQRRRPEAVPAEIIVLPRLGFVHRGRLRRLLRQASPEADAIRRRRPQRHPSAQAEFHGLRAWRPGDSPRFIHWRTSARRGELMVREYEDVPSDNLILILDPTPGRGPDGVEQVEAAVSLAATICWEWSRHTGDRLMVGVADGTSEMLDGVAGPGHGRRALELLALTQTMHADIGALQGRLTALADVAAAAVVVSTADSLLTRPMARILRRPVTCLDVTSAAILDFYDPPSDPEEAVPAGRKDVRLIGSRAFA